MADTDSSLTPEQRLLKIIESGEGSAPETSPASAGEPGKPGKVKTPREPINWKELLSPAGVKARFEYLQGTIQDSARRRAGALRIKDINRGLGIACLVLALAVIGNAAFEMSVLSHDFLSRFDLSQKKMADLLMGGTHDPAQLFQDEAPRNVFAPYMEQAADTQAKSNDVALKLMEMSKTLKLTGISFFEGDVTRTFCMIEDLQKNITTFLKQGDSFSGMTVKEIKPESVILSLGDEELEIR